MTETNYLNPDVEVIAEVNTPASFETFGESINTGHGVIGTTHSEDIQTLVNRVVEQGLPTYLLEEIDLVVFPHHVDGERYVAEAVELVDADGYDDLTGSRLPRGTVEKGGRTLHWNTVLRRSPEGEFTFDYAHPHVGDEHRALGLRTFHRLAARTDRSVEAVETEFHRKRRYVQYLEREGFTDFERLFGFLSDLRADESATAERVRGRTSAATDGSGGDEQ